MSETVASEIDIEADLPTIFGVLIDFESYPQWAKSIKNARVLERSADGRPEKVEFHVAPGLLPDMRYVLRYSYADDELSWDYVEGDLKEIKGSYALRSIGAATHVTYNLAIDPGRLPLPGFVKARAAREITRIALKELKRRVEGG